MPTIKFPLRHPPQPSAKVDAISRVNDLVETSKGILFRAQTVFPFDFFPDKIIVTREKVDIIYGIFIGSKEMVSVTIDRIFDVTVDHDLFFATVTFRLQVGQEVVTPLRFLKKSDAIKLRQIITGLVITSKQKIDLKHFSDTELKHKMVEVGKAR